MALDPVFERNNRKWRKRMQVAQIAVKRLEQRLDKIEGERRQVVKQIAAHRRQIALALEALVSEKGGQQ